jgi:hypothetical protein
VTFEVPRGISQRDATKRAEAKLAELLHEIDKGTFVDASKTTLIDDLRNWHASRRSAQAARDGALYSSFIETHVAKASIATMPLQKVRKTDLERFYNADLTGLSASSVTVCHAMFSDCVPTSASREAQDGEPHGLPRLRSSARARAGAPADARPSSENSEEGARRRSVEATHQGRRHPVDQVPRAARLMILLTVK